MLAIVVVVYYICAGFNEEVMKTYTFWNWEETKSILLGDFMSFEEAWHYFLVTDMQLPKEDLWHLDCL